MVKILPKPSFKSRPIKNLIPFSRYSKIRTYRKIPEQLLELSVLKLDGSSFSFHVARNATVDSLKLAIEEEFCISSKDENEILWPLVWSHFSLCYKGQKLISEKASIQKYGIKDGDQLQFIQHLRIDLAPTSQQSKNQCAQFKHLAVTNVGDARVEDQNTDLQYFHHEDDLAFPIPKSKLTHCLKEVLTCSSFQCPKRKACEIKDYY